MRYRSSTLICSGSRVNIYGLVNLKLCIVNSAKNTLALGCQNTVVTHVIPTSLLSLSANSAENEPQQICSTLHYQIGTNLNNQNLPHVEVGQEDRSPQEVYTVRRVQEQHPSPLHDVYLLHACRSKKWRTP